MYKNSKTIVITGDIGNDENSFSKYISLDFQPDEVKIKRINIFDNQSITANKIILFHSDLVYPTTIYAYATGFTVAINDEAPPVTTSTYVYGHNDIVDASFKINNIINSTYKFWVTDQDNGPLANIATSDMNIAITLVFYEYQK
jgi:hypothetical protein